MKRSCWAVASTGHLCISIADAHSNVRWWWPYLRLGLRAPSLPLKPRLASYGWRCPHPAPHFDWSHMVIDGRLVICL
jgi:hypothetical protein